MDMTGQFAAVAFLFWAGHQVGDYWVQTDWQAQTKAKLGWEGRYACVAHVLTYTFTLALFVFAGSAVLGFTLPLAGYLTALGLSAVTHYFADRRTPLRRLCVLIGKAEFWDRGGQPLLDQSWHLGWLAVCALVAVRLGAGLGWC